MKTKLIPFLLFISLSCTNCLAQSNCDTIYKYTEVEAKFKNESNDLNSYFDKNIIPILVRNMEKGDEMITRLSIVFIINLHGKVIDLDFPHSKLSENCKAELKKEILTMEDWKPAQMFNQPVCSRYLLQISCLKWQ